MVLRLSEVRFLINYIESDQRFPNELWDDLTGATASAESVFDFDPLILANWYSLDRIKYKVYMKINCINNSMCSKSACLRESIIKEM